jgi:hypothetical protein
MAKKILHHERGLRDPQIMHPEREWVTGLAVMVGLFIACAAWSAQMYLSNLEVSIEEQAGEHVTQTVYRDAQVKEALKVIDQRDRELQELLGNALPALPVEEVATSTATTTEEIVENASSTEGW